MDNVKQALLEARDQFLTYHTNHMAKGTPEAAEKAKVNLAMAVMMTKGIEAYYSTHTDETIRQLQSSLPWTAHYHRDFRATPMTHKDFSHGLLHIHKAGGKLAAIIDDAEHGGVKWEDPSVRVQVANYLADMVICAMRMANTCPDGVIDLQRAVEDRLEAKNNQLAKEAPLLAAMERK